MLAEMMAVERKRERQRAASRKWRAANLERAREADRKYRAENGEELRAKERARYALDRPRNIEKQRKWRAENPEKMKEALRKCRLKREYGLTVEQRDELFRLQDSACAICRSSKTGGRGWHIDHCHETGMVRGILCQHCNIMLGHARDNVEILGAAILYLKKGTPQ